MVQIVLRRPIVEAATGLSRSTIYRLMAHGSFPKPIKLGTKAVGWIETEVKEWQAAQIAKRDVREAA